MSYCTARAVPSERANSITVLDTCMSWHQISVSPSLSWLGLYHVLYYTDLLINLTANFLSPLPPLQPLPLQLQVPVMPLCSITSLLCIVWERDSVCEQNTWVSATLAKSAKPVPQKAVTLSDCSLCFCLPKWYIFLGRLKLLYLKCWSNMKQNLNMKKYLQ